MIPPNILIKQHGKILLLLYSRQMDITVPVSTSPSLKDATAKIDNSKDFVPCSHYLDESELAVDSAIGNSQFSILIYPALATKEIVHTCCYFVPLILVTILRKLHIYTTCTDPASQHCNTKQGQLYV
jgi:hypothetical protein